MSDPLLDAAAEPLRDLAKRYRTLERFAARMAETLEQACALPAAVPAATGSDRPPVAKVETPTSAAGALLDFQEQLAGLEGVQRVTVAGSTADRTTFIVELVPEEHRHRQVCARCGRILAEGIEPASHGLCEDCRTVFGT